MLSMHLNAHPVNNPSLSITELLHQVLDNCLFQKPDISGFHKAY